MLGKYRYGQEIIDTPRGPMSRREAAAEFKIPFGTICRRIWEGQPPEKIFKPYVKPPLIKKEVTRKRKSPIGYFITPWGRMSLAKISEKIGFLSQNTLANRLYQYGWTQEEAFNTPIYGKPGLHFILPPEEYKRLILECVLSEQRIRGNKRKRRKRHD